MLLEFLERHRARHLFRSSHLKSCVKWSVSLAKQQTEKFNAKRRKDTLCYARLKHKKVNLSARLFGPFDGARGFLGLTLSYFFR